MMQIRRDEFIYDALNRMLTAASYDGDDLLFSSIEKGYDVLLKAFK